MKDQFAFLSQKKFWIEIVALVAALLVGAAAVYYFLIPGNLILGSISGLAMVICSLLESAGIAMKVSVMVLILNAFLLILAYVFLGPEVGLKTIIASLLLGPFMDLWAWICPYDRLIEPGLTSVMGDPIFDLLGFVLLLGASQAFLFRINASTGGLDIVAMIMKKYLHWDIGTSVTVSGVIVCLSSFLVNPFRLVVIGLIGTWFNGIVVDYFTVSLNKRLQQVLNPPRKDKKEKAFGDVVFREGDRVMQIKNNYDILWQNESRTAAGSGIYNGDIGTILSIDMDSESLSVNFDGRIASYGFDSLIELEHAWAMTVHKSQGSEYRAVILSLSPGSQMLLTRDVLYTAVTRAKELLIMVGDDATAYKMIDNFRQSKRYSALRVRLRKLCGVEQ